MAGPGSTSARLIAPPPPAYLEMALAAPPAELPSHMNPDSMEVEGAEEWAFFRAYWPHGMPPPGGNIPSPPDSNRSTAVPDDISEREPKTARKEETKGGDGRGSGSQGSGNGGNGKGGRAGAGGVKRQQGNGQQGNGGGNGSNWNRGSGGSSFGARGSDWGNRGGWRGDGRSGQGDSSDRDLRDVYYVLQLMQRLLLRHEDSINLLKVESSFVMHMKLNVPSSVVSMLYAAANSWREVKLAEPTKLDRPMRAALLYCLFMELKTRLEAVAEKPEDLERMSKLGWITLGPPITWSFLTLGCCQQQADCRHLQSATFPGRGYAACSDGDPTMPSPSHCRPFSPDAPHGGGDERRLFGFPASDRAAWRGCGGDAGLPHAAMP